MTRRAHTPNGTPSTPFSPHKMSRGGTASRLALDEHDSASPTRATAQRRRLVPPCEDGREREENLLPSGSRTEVTFRPNSNHPCRHASLPGHRPDYLPARITSLPVPTDAPRVSTGRQVTWAPPPRYPLELPSPKSTTDVGREERAFSAPLNAAVAFVQTVQSAQMQLAVRPAPRDASSWK